MSAISQQDLALVIVGSAYLLITAGWLWWLNRAAAALLRSIQHSEPAELWQAIGAPASLRHAMKDPQRRWLKFIRDRSYRRLCSAVTASRIDEFRLHTSIALLVLALAGVVILYRFWPLLKPHLSGA